jgi:hypothetical protein
MMKNLDTLYSLDMVLVLFTLLDDKKEPIFKTTYLYDNSLSPKEVEAFLKNKYGNNFVGLCNISR